MTTESGHERARPGPRRPARRILSSLAIACIALPASGDPFIGLQLGSMSVDEGQASRPRNYAIHLGYELDTIGFEANLIGEFNRTLDDGRTRKGETLELESDGLYLMLKTHRHLFASLHFGYVENRIVRGDTAQTERGLAYGGGIGVSVGSSRVRLEYSRLADDAGYFRLSLDHWL